MVATQPSPDALTVSISRLEDGTWRVQVNEKPHVAGEGSTLEAAAAAARQASIPRKWQLSADDDPLAETRACVAAIDEWVDDYPDVKAVSDTADEPTRPWDDVKRDLEL